MLRKEEGRRCCEVSGYCYTDLVCYHCTYLVYSHYTDFAHCYMDLVCSHCVDLANCLHTVSLSCVDPRALSSLLRGTLRSVFLRSRVLAAQAYRDVLCEDEAGSRVVWERATPALAAD